MPNCLKSRKTQQTVASSQRPISSISDVKFSHSGRHMMTREYLSVKVWDLAMESRPVETFQVHEYLRCKLCSLYKNDCIFDKFECSWSGDDRHIMTGSYNCFRMFDKESKWDYTLEAPQEITNCFRMFDRIKMGLYARSTPRDHQLFPHV